MAEIATTYDPAAYLDRNFERKGVGGWRGLYLRFIDRLAPASIAEFGAGAPDFLDQVEARRRVAIDIGERFAREFEERHIEFVCRDLESDAVSDLGPVDVAICSDVFEHLVNPAVALDRIVGALQPSGVLFSHVPNEFRLGHVLAVMTDRRQTLLFHKNSQEWEDPHLRRFTDIGYRAFLARCFRYNLRLTDLRYGRAARWLKWLGARVPYCLQGGPTYASTNDEAIFDRLIELKAEVAGG
ncbi:MAG TPA: methyltransferase domain-containing protein [Rhizomicrobium sp.]|nr:methyltransferase domain-containing protein [Rhizomicrobium sp.]